MNTRYLTLLFIALLAVALSGCGLQPAPAPSIDTEYSLKTARVDGKMVFVGTGGEIDGLVNPDLVAHTGDSLRLIIINGDGVPHDLAIPDMRIQTSLLTQKDKTSQVVFQPKSPGEFVYYCTVSGHRQVGMEGKLVVKSA